MNGCAGRAADAADTTRRPLLAELRGNPRPGAQAELRELQSQWMALRDRYCRWEQSFFEGGSVAPMINASCRAALTQERIGRLKLFLCEGAGMAGPCEASRSTKPWEQSNKRMAQAAPLGSRVRDDRRDAAALCAFAHRRRCSSWCWTY